jgi:hypothetical protein
MGSAIIWAIFSQTHLASLAGTPSPGVYVIITIFCDFRQFSAKKLAFFSKSNVVIQFLHEVTVV